VAAPDCPCPPAACMRYGLLRIKALRMSLTLLQVC
jgi:hypothetical protein